MKPSEKHTVIGLISAGIILRIALLILMPLYPEGKLLPGYNDEPLHLHYVKHIDAGNGWPIYKPTGIDSIDHIRGEFLQSPLYYTLAAPAYRIGTWIHSGWELYGTRLMSVLFGIIGAIFAYYAILAFTKRRTVALSVLAAMSLAPNAVVFSAIVTNDALLICLSAVMFHSLILCRTRNGGTFRQMITGVLFASLVWTKLSGILLFPLIWFAADPKNTYFDQWIVRGRVVLTAIILLTPLIIWRLFHYGYIFFGGGDLTQSQYLPEEAVGVTSGALYHPFMAIKLWLRTAAQPFLYYWGSIPEKTISFGWIVFWCGLMIYGLWLSIYERSRGMIFLLAIILLTSGFAYRGLNMFQVEFRLYAPVFVALAYYTALGAEQLKIPVWIQGLLWSIPILLIPLF